MKTTKKYINLILIFAFLTTLVFSTQGNVLAQPTLQNENEQDVPPLFPDLNWEHAENVQKDLRIKGQTLTLTGESFEAFFNLSEKNNVIQYYSPEYLESSGWMFVSDNGVDLVFDNEAGQYLSVTNSICLDSENYCISVWVGNATQSTQEKSFALKVGPIGYNKISPANGAIVPKPASTYYFLTWTDALLQDNYPDDRYQYCIDTTNNNSCDADNWITRNSLYSGDTEFTLTEDVTYYWQVRTRDTLIYANGAASAWWSFKIAPAVVGFNKITPTNNATINMPTTTYRLLNWGDALLAEDNRYEYCIDTTNNNACDNNAWVNRNSLYSGGGVGEFDFPLVYGQTYYWQVRTKNDPQVYSDGNANTWFKFTVQAILPAPMVSSINRKTPATATTNAASVEFSVTFTMDVVGVDVSDFNLTSTDSVAGASVTSVSGSGSIYTVTVNTGTGDGTLRLNFVDNDTVLNIQAAPVGGVGVANGNFITGQAYTMERLFPSVVSSVPSTTATPGIINFTVTFTENVTGVNAADFSFTTTGAISGHSITSVSATSPSTVYTVTVHTGNAGAGTIRLNVIDDDTIQDVATNPLGGVGAGNGNFTTGTVFNKSTFADVPTSGSPWSLYEPAIKSLFDAGITGGCGGGYYCPENNVSRAEMAVFLLRGIYGGAYLPPAATGTVFTDVSISHPFAAWIEQLATEGITTGCGGGNYCPSNNVSRAEMAVFLLRADYGSGYIPPVATGTMFTDVPLTNPFVAWIEQLANQGVTSGCGGGNFCPNNPVIRAQMAVFLKNIFGIP